MFDFPLNYEEPIYRPPSERESLLIQTTIGCSHNKCVYCDMYRSKTYRVRTLDEIYSDLEKAAAAYREYGTKPRKIFLCDGDALAAPMNILLPTLDKIAKLFPNIRRIGVYATAQNILEKTNDELRELASRKLSIAYLGVESGSNSVMKRIVKGVSSAEMLEASLKIQACNWQLSVMIMLGIGGRELSTVHREETSSYISQVAPNFFSFLTTMVLPDTPLSRMVEKGKFEPLTTRELLEEMRDILKEIKLNNAKVIFRANHVSNQFPLAGILPRDINTLVNTLEQWVTECPPNVFPELPDSSL